MSSRNCQYSIRRVHKTCRKYMAMSSRRETRAQQQQQSRKIRPDRLSLSLISGPSERSRPIDLSRARRRTHGTPRTSRTSRGAYSMCNAITRRRRTRNSPSRSGIPLVVHPQPPTTLTLANGNTSPPKDALATVLEQSGLL